MTDVPRELPELLPCPFCGESAQPPRCDGSDDEWEIVCNGYDCYASMTEDTEGRVIATWNRRAYAESCRGEWQPIETAPHEVRVLLWDGRWVSAGAYCEYDSIGWVMDSDNEDDEGPRRAVTHWQPLAAAPSPDNNEE